MSKFDGRYYSKSRKEIKNESDGDGDGDDDDDDGVGDGDDGKRERCSIFDMFMMSSNEDAVKILLSYFS